MSEPSYLFEDSYLLGQQALARGDACAAYQHWVSCISRVNSVAYYSLLANAFRSIGALTESDQLIDLALKHTPGDLGLLSDKVNLILEQGESNAAAELYIKLAKQALEIGQDEQSLTILSNALIALEYSEKSTPESKKKLAAQWGEAATTWARNIVERERVPSHTHRKDSGKPLRIGFISGDLCAHPVGFLMLPLLHEPEPVAWTPYIYDIGSREDATHRHLRRYVQNENWRLCFGLSDAAIMKLIISDQLDCLIDLSGHTARSKLRLMAHRLAKVQLSWLGFSGTTGLPTIDGIILDAVLSDETEAQFSEQIINLEPSRFCFSPPFSPRIQEPPCLKNGHITFGSFNNTSKYNGAMLKTWASIMLKVPHSRLILKWRTFDDMNFRKKIHDTFSSYGISNNRVLLRGFSTHRQMLDEYGEVDIALDTYPFNGGFTTLEALWMGLPVVTLAGTTPISRQSASFLTAINKTDWISHSHDVYAAIACNLANDMFALKKIRDTQRLKLMDNPMCDPKHLKRSFELLLASICRHRTPLTY